MSDFRLRPPLRTVLLAALLLGGAGLAHGQDGPGCDAGACQAGRIDAAAVRAAVRAAVHDAEQDAARAGAAGRPGLQASPPPASAADASGVWDRKLGGPGPHEDYNCALSFGAAGTLGGEGSLATRLLGHTQVWRGK